MALSNCHLCGKLYLLKESRFCKECNEQYEQKFRVFKDQLMENPRMSVLEGIEKTGIPSKLIMEWVREGRIHLS